MADLEQYQQDFRDRCDAKIAERTELQECAQRLAKSALQRLRVTAERDRYRQALEEIASRATVERNPDDDDQAAHTMQLIAREALNADA